MDKTGSGKTLSAVLSTIYENSKFTLIICPVNIVEQWKQEIRRACPHAFISGGDKRGFDVHTNTNPDWSVMKNIPIRRYHIVNYDKLSTDSRNAKRLVEDLMSKSADFIIVDEAQNVKIRDEYNTINQLINHSKTVKVSKRRQNMELIIANERTKRDKQTANWLDSETKNLKINSNKYNKAKRKAKKLMSKPLNVMFLSATPVINGLPEGKSLIRLLTGSDYKHLNTTNTQKNACELYREFQPYAVRSLTDFGVKVNGLEPDKAINTYIDLPWEFQKQFAEENKSVLFWETLATKARIPAIIKKINGKTIIYTIWVGGEKGNTILDMLERACVKAGKKVGFFVGANKENGLTEEKAHGGLIDKSKPKNPDGTYFSPFIQGDTDVLIASHSLAEGFDGLQKVCNNLILNGLPWTYAEIEQIVGRLNRKNQVNDTVNVSVILANIGKEGKEGVDYYPYDKKLKQARLDYKRQFSNIVIDGNINSFNDDKKDLMEKITNVIEWAKRKGMKWEFYEDYQEAEA